MPVTRWWLEGSGGALVLVTESGQEGDPSCQILPPERPHMRPDTDLRGPGPDRPWLSATGIGVVTTHGDGAHGWIDTFATARHDPPKPKKKKRVTQEGMP